MRVLIVHNRYRQRGGEDAVFEAERDLLIANGAQVRTLECTNDDIPQGLSFYDGAKLAVGTTWSRGGAAAVGAAAAEHRAEVVHFHNTFPLVSPAAYAAARRAGAATVQTLHNYRLLCVNACLYRDRAPCEDCVGRPVAWPGIVHACYRDSRAQSAVVATMQTVHRTLGTWHRHVDRYIALTQFGRSLFVRGGFPADRIDVKPNFVDLPAPPEPRARSGMLFVGRLEEEKGIGHLLEAWSAWQQRGAPALELRVAGTGSLAERVAAAARALPDVTLLGQVDRAAVLRELSRALALIFTSTWFEGFPVTIVEAFASGTPVIAARLGAMAEIVSDGQTGLLYTQGDPDDLRTKLSWVLQHPARLAAMGINARARYEEDYTPEENHRQILAIYERAVAQRQSGRAGVG